MPIDIRKALKKMLPHFLQAKQDNLNEADTVLRLIKFLEDVLGYDPMTEISREAEMKKQFVEVRKKRAAARRTKKQAAPEKLTDPASGGEQAAGSDS